MRKNNQSIGSNAAFALLVAVAALGCAGQQQTTERNKGVVREFYRVFSTGNVADILALMRDDATYWVSGSVQGFSGVKAQLAEVLAGVGDLYVGGSLPLAPTTLIAEGELVFAEASGRAELKNGRVLAETGSYGPANIAANKFHRTTASFLTTTPSNRLSASAFPPLAAPAGGS